MSSDIPSCPPPCNDPTLPPLTGQTKHFLCGVCSTPTPLPSDPLSPIPCSNPSCVHSHTPQLLASVWHPLGYINSCITSSSSRCSIISLAKHVRCWACGRELLAGVQSRCWPCLMRVDSTWEIRWRWRWVGALEGARWTLREVREKELEVVMMEGYEDEFLLGELDRRCRRKAREKRGVWGDDGRKASPYVMVLAEGCGGGEEKIEEENTGMATSDM